MLRRLFTVFLLSVVMFGAGAIAQKKCPLVQDLLGGCAGSTRGCGCDCGADGLKPIRATDGKCHCEDKLNYATCQCCSACENQNRFDRSTKPCDCADCKCCGGCPGQAVKKKGCN